ncbi:MAG TPA: NUDIX domain-containing protein [Muribaculum sp.]|jgi:isopentenyldiphosphate isomerase|uniref:NUDIX domain-containing protein n=1 Tax=Heminiphilus faecis TaxID=2601703 RepID=A0ABV4D1S8_9BACT|nr:NUDIX domain-containing protein [Heminiphilus faecis]RLT76816.1 NUDIX domain-containing protein [bacterium J10(2018)]HRF68181.1 NUDIX domain-containing protein [Muribaculum sp.]
MISEELFPIVDEVGNVTGRATRSECHGGSMLLHPVVHLHVMREGGFLYLQKRAMDKDIQPGKWDTAVGGHVDFGESIAEALFREASEELGLRGFVPTKLPPYVFTSDRERELVNPYYVIVAEDEVLAPDPGEITEGRFWHVDEIKANVGRDVFTPNFENEFELIKDYIK